MIVLLLAVKCKLNWTEQGPEQNDGRQNTREKQGGLSPILIIIVQDMNQLSDCRISQTYPRKVNPWLVSDVSLSLSESVLSLTRPTHGNSCCNSAIFIKILCNNNNSRNIDTGETNTYAIESFAFDLGKNSIVTYHTLFQCRWEHQWNHRSTTQKTNRWNREHRLT